MKKAKTTILGDMYNNWSENGDILHDENTNRAHIPMETSEEFPPVAPVHITAEAVATSLLVEFRYFPLGFCTKYSAERCSKISVIEGT